MRISNFINDESGVILGIKEEMENFFSKDTLVINDTRGMIIPHVLPYIEFVCVYDQRVLPILKNTNLVLTYPFDNKVLKYYQSLGLGNDVNIILTENNKEITLAKNIAEDEAFLEKLKQYNFKKIIPFFVNDNMQELSDKMGVPLSVTKEIFEKANNKLLLKKYLIEAKLPTINGDFTNDKEIIQSYFEREERFLFKDPLGVSGYGFWDNKENTLDDILQNYHGKDLIIERFIDKKDSPSLQFFISEDGKNAFIFGITDQLLENGKIYLGNVSPSHYLNSPVLSDIIAQGEEIIKYIASLGYVGFGGIDFIVDTDDNVYTTEVNARFTGATYPAITSMLLHNTLLKKWEFKNYEGECEKVSDFLEKKSIQNVGENGIFPLGISGIEQFGKANLLEFK